MLLRLQKEATAPYCPQVSEVKARTRSGLAGPGSPLWALAFLDGKYGTAGGLQEERLLPFSEVAQNMLPKMKIPTLALTRREAFSACHHYWSRKRHE